MALATSFIIITKKYPLINLFVVATSHKGLYHVLNSTQVVLSTLEGSPHDVMQRKPFRVDLFVVVDNWG